ncbi:MAG: polysaccharide deacetylase [Lachnospiraceae bacterium]|nr:polysaccharide deacetylase [Lachnospiraceae bacterium]
MNRRTPKKTTYNRRYAKRRKKLLQRQLLMAGACMVVIAAIVFVLVALANKQPENKKTVSEKPTSTEQQTEVPTETITEKESSPEQKPETKDGVIKSKNGKTLYLTFDDGPSENTDAILDILNQYGVKATFFVLAIEGEEDHYKEILNRGHEIGVHSTSHDYGIVYANLDSFKEDVSYCRNLVEGATGHKLFLYRFPGGTNNEVHNVSISSCIEYLDSVGLKHFDWNVSSGDAAGVTVDKEEIKNNILEQVRGKSDEVMVVLMHDSYAKTTTVEALRELLPVLIEEGFGFSKITPDTPEITFSAYD